MGLIVKDQWAYFCVKVTMRSGAMATLPVETGLSFTRVVVPS